MTICVEINNLRKISGASNDNMGRNEQSKKNKDKIELNKIVSKYKWFHSVGKY